MNQKYLKGIILEQKSRGEYLIELTDKVRFNYLSNLKTRCKEKIELLIEILDYLYNELENRDENDYRDIFRSLRMVIMRILIIEYFGISALYHQVEEAEFVNRLIPIIYNDIKLELEPPTVACISTNYFSYSPFTNVILIPLGETNFILHLVDLFHEIGHGILNELENKEELNFIKKAYYEAVDIINDYYSNLLLNKEREGGPKGIRREIRRIYSHWKDWINEFFCDIFACYVVGPAYVWCHYHLSSKISQDIYTLHERHPSDEARMRILIQGLKKLGFFKSANEISSYWKKMPIAIRKEPKFNIIYAYDENLFEHLIKVFYEGFERNNIKKIHYNELKLLNNDCIINILNRAWRKFVSKPEDFKDWESKMLDKLKKF